MNRSATPWLATALLGLALSAGAQTGSAGTTGTTGNPGPAGTTATMPPATGTANPKSAATSMDRSDRRFVENAAEGGIAEVAMGRLAQMRAVNPKVKAFGERMVQDHGKANEELKAVATAKGMTLPQETSRSMKRDADRLGKLQGADFDREYMKHMVDDHKKDVKDFEKAAKDAKDPDVKAFAAKTLPVLQEHRQLAETTYDAVKNARNDRSAATSGTGSTR